MNARSGLMLLSILLCLIIALSSCKQGTPAIAVASPEARISSMIVGSGSIFVEIVNAGTGDDRLRAAHAEIPGAVTEIHDVQEGKMIKVDSIRIPAKSTVVLKPGSFHIMLFNMPKDVKEGYEFTLELVFEKTGALKLPLKLSANMPMGNRDHEMHSH